MPSSSSIPFAQASERGTRDGAPSTWARYSFSTPYDGWVRRWVSSPSLVSSSNPSVSASSRPTGNTRGWRGTNSTTVGTPLRIVGGGDHPGRLVEQVVDEVGADSDDRAVHLHQVDLGVDPAPQHRDLSVDGDPTLGRSAPHRPAGCRDPTRASTFWSRSPSAVTTDRAPPAPRRSVRRRAPPAGPRSRASTTSLPGKKSPSGGRSLIESRPRRSRKVGVVP